MRKKRKARPKLGSGYDSKLEEDLSKNMGNCQWKPDPITYTSVKKYNPDARFGNTIIEIKGRFRTHEEAAKYIWIRECLEEGEELVFVFSSPNTPMPRARKRRDGTRKSVSDWADQHGFKWYSNRTIPDEWR